MRHTNHPPLISRLVEGALLGLMTTFGFGVLGLFSLLLWVFLTS